MSDLNVYCSTNETRLDGENALLLTPSVGHLFDRAFVSFENDRRLLVSPVAHAESLRKMGIPDAGFRTGPLTAVSGVILIATEMMCFSRRTYAVEKSAAQESLKLRSLMFHRSRGRCCPRLARDEVREVPITCP